MNFFQEIFFAIWFFLPAGLANMFPIFAAHLPGLMRLNAPMDFHLNFRGKPIFGDNKTWRGFIVAALVGVVVVIAEKSIYTHWQFARNTFPLDYSKINPLSLGLLLGIGAILGDAVESFFKRQLGISAGSSWFLFDQIDFIFGAILFSYWYAPLSLVQYVYIVVVYFLLHLISAFAGFLLGLKKKAI